MTHSSSRLLRQRIPRSIDGTSAECHKDTSHYVTKSFPVCGVAVLFSRHQLLLGMLLVGKCDRFSLCLVAEICQRRASIQEKACHPDAHLISVGLILPQCIHSSSVIPIFDCRSKLHQISFFALLEQLNRFSNSLVDFFRSWHNRYRLYSLA